MTLKTMIRRRRDGREIAEVERNVRKNVNVTDQNVDIFLQDAMDDIEADEFANADEFRLGESMMMMRISMETVMMMMGMVMIITMRMMIRNNPPYD
jgi:hypothetical protein